MAARRCEPVDDVDRQWIRFGASAFGTVAGTGIAFASAAQYLAFICSNMDCGLEAMPMFGLLAAWAAMGAMAGGLWGWRRDVPSGAAAAMFLAFMALHFTTAATWNLYGPLLASALGIGLLLTADETGPIVAFLAYWTLAAALGVVALWQGTRALAWLVARWEVGQLPRT